MIDWLIDWLTSDCLWLGDIMTWRTWNSNQWAIDRWKCLQLVVYVARYVSHCVFTVIHLSQVDVCLVVWMTTQQPQSVSSRFAEFQLLYALICIEQFDWHVLWAIYIFFFHVCCLYWFYFLFVCLSVCFVCICLRAVLLDCKLCVYALYVCMGEGLAYTLFQPGLTIDNTTCTVCARHV